MPSSSDSATIVEKGREAAGVATRTARKLNGPLVALAAGTAGLAAGVALGARRTRPRGPFALISRRREVLGVPIGRKSGFARTAENIGRLAKELNAASAHAGKVSSDIHDIRDQLEAANRQSPVEVLLDGLTHRRGAHKREG